MCEKCKDTGWINTPGGWAVCDGCDIENKKPMSEEERLKREFDRA